MHRRYRSFLCDGARWDAWAPRPGDIVISTSPKCGTTWTQMICALLIFQSTDLPGKLTDISPWLDIETAPLDDVIATLEAQTHRRFIKTHIPIDGIPLHDDVTYIGVGRTDPRDVALSWDVHMSNTNFEGFLNARMKVPMDDAALALVPTEMPPDDPVERFWRFVDDDGPIEQLGTTLRSTVHHVATVWEQQSRPNVVLLHYADLQADLEGAMRSIASRLGIDVPDAAWPSLVEAATFSRMKERAADLAPQVTDGFWNDPDQFFNRGSSGAWRDFLDADGAARYDARLSALAFDPELVAWLHR